MLEKKRDLGQWHLIPDVNRSPFRQGTCSTMVAGPFESPASNSRGSTKGRTLCPAASRGPVDMQWVRLTTDPLEKTVLDAKSMTTATFLPPFTAGNYCRRFQIGAFMSEDYYRQKVEEMLTLTSAAHDPPAKQEFERLAEEYRARAKSAREQSRPERA